MVSQQIAPTCQQSANCDEKRFSYLVERFYLFCRACAEKKKNPRTFCLWPYCDYWEQPSPQLWKNKTKQLIEVQYRGWPYIQFELQSSKRAQVDVNNNLGRPEQEKVSR